MPKTPTGSESEPTDSQVIWGGRVKVELSKSHRYSVWTDGVKASPRGVTTALSILDKPQLIGWAVGEALDYVHEYKHMIEDPQIWVNAQQASEGKKQASADVGTLIHDWCDKHIRGLNPEMPKDKDVVRGVLSFLHWVEEHDVKFLESERFVYSDKYSYVGKLDFTMTVGGVPCLGDLKTGNGLYPSVAMQTAAYVKALTEETGVEYAGRWAIRVAKETEEEYISRNNLKNESKARRGMNPSKVKPYVPFEARFFSNDTLEADFQAFLWCNNLTTWNNDTAKAFRD